MDKFMNEALLEAQKGIKKGGGPFGAVVVKSGKIVGRGYECVLQNSDPTAHAEIVAIRNASKNLKTHNLSGCVIYTTSEPCAMCMATIIEAKIKKCYFGCALEDGFDLGYTDNNFYNLLEVKHDEMTECLDRQECLELFYTYSKKKDKRFF
mgnify:CR=1 FL=1